MEYKTISADTHIDIPWLPAEQFVSNAPEQYRPHMPRVEDTDSVMWGSNYPHHDGVWPYSQRVIKEDL